MGLTNLPPSLASNTNLTALANAFDQCITLAMQPLMPMLSEVCPSDYLAWLAQNFSLNDEPNWAVATTIEQQRDIIKKAIALHRFKGTPQAVKTILSDANLDATLTEPTDKPNYYQVTIQARSAAHDQNFINTLSLITRAAPVSSLPMFLVEDLGKSQRSAIPVAITILRDATQISKSLALNLNMNAQGYASAKQSQAASQSLTTPKQTKLTAFAHLRSVS